MLRIEKTKAGCKGIEFKGIRQQKDAIAAMEKARGRSNFTEPGRGGPHSSFRDILGKSTQNNTAPKVCAKEGNKYQ